jgi:dTDP-4-amino-4,6-dideoxygalactose transaminase
MNVPLLDLSGQYQSLKSELDAALIRVAESQRFILGREVEMLERATEEYLEVRHALGVSSGTDALLLALMALGVGPGDEVIVPTFSFFATAGVVSRLHAVPVFVDVDPVTWNIDPAAIERAVTEKTRAIIPVHLFGQSADMGAIMEIAGRLGLPVVEDAAQAIGTRYRDGRRVGAIGTVGCYSFFPTKNLGGFGDGGLVVTNDSELFERMKLMRVHGGERRYHYRIIGGNFRLDELQAAVLNVKLPHLDAWSNRRRQNAGRYNRLLTAPGVSQGSGRTEFDADNTILLPADIHEGEAPFTHIYNQYSVRCQNRDAVRESLAAAGIGSEVYYPIPLHQQECFEDLGYREGSMPVAERVAHEILALPIFPELADEQIDYVAKTLRECTSYVVRGS